MRRQELHREAAIAVRKALRESLQDDAPSRRWSEPVGGDNLRLRGIPAVGRGVAGAIRGTAPHNVRD